MDSKSQGNGVFICEEGEYKGEWYWDQREGFGTFIWADGRKYTGEWYDDKQHGKVQYIDGQGNMVVGEYVEGQLVLYDKKQGKPGFEGWGLLNLHILADDTPFLLSPSAGHARRTGEPETGHILEPLSEKKHE